MFFDGYGDGTYYYSDSYDTFATWTAPAALPAISGTARHFTVIKETVIGRTGLAGTSRAPSAPPTTPPATGRHSPRCSTSRWSPPPAPPPRSRRPLSRSSRASPTAAATPSATPPATTCATGTSAPASTPTTAHDLRQGRHVLRPGGRVLGLRPLRVVQLPRALPAPLRLPTPLGPTDGHGPVPAGQLVRAGDGLGLSCAPAELGRSVGGCRMLPSGSRSSREFPAK